MRLLADVHISPRTVTFLQALGHDVLRVADVSSLGASASDASILALAAADARAVLTQDLDFGAMVAVSGGSAPSVITLRLSSSRIERVNERLDAVLPVIAGDLEDGALVTIEDALVRTRQLPAR